MDSERLQYLITRYHNSCCTKEELAELNEWYEQLGTESKQMDYWMSDAGGEELLAEEMFKNFNKKIKSEKNSYWRSWSWQISAAVVFILMSVGLLFYRLFTSPVGGQIAVAQAEVLPGKNKAVLTLADGSKVMLDDLKAGVVSRQNGVLITKTAAGSLAYQTVENPKITSNKLAYNTLSVPRGGQYIVVLPDGTKVWLNSASTLYFPVTSNGKDRQVRLTGEAYFEVAHNKQLPFKVLTGGQLVQVLGTHFNIKGYPEDSNIATTLLEGSVKIHQLSSGHSRMLIPGQQAKVIENNSEIDISQVKTDQEVAWKNGYFLFDNQDIKTVMKTISRWYDVDVIYKNAPGNDRFGGTFSRNTNLSELLGNLEELGDVHFQIDQRRIIVSHALSSN